MGSSQQEVEVSYGVSNEFFELWLDERMNYICALYDDTKNFSDNFEQAQDNKLKRLSRMAGITRQTESMLDIGCGWGANIEYQALINKVPNVYGITLSEEQWKKCVDRKLPNTTALCKNFWQYEPDTKFDAVMSICMVEHMVTPEDARAGKAVDIYRNYFKPFTAGPSPARCLACRPSPAAMCPASASSSITCGMRPTRFFRVR